MSAAITIDGISKCYQIGTQSQPYNTLRDTIMSAITTPFKRLAGRKGQAAKTREFWALKDVSFDVKKGEVIGIIGRNGAGKSTLLKVLSRITEPTQGFAKLKGRVASLLEVGTGFHPELTGRENVYLNGAILGMHKVEIDRKFDQIVAFAETEKFLDTPVKYYSSGMYVRLAFAVAAHLEPEILIVDEVLAVGDQEFQKKCLGRMREVSQGDGRTVLFVSHNIAAIRSLCDRAAYLRNGQLVTVGPAEEVVTEYLNAAKGNEETNLLMRPRFPGIAASISGFSAKPAKDSDHLVSGGSATFEVEMTIQDPIQNAAVTVMFCSDQGYRVLAYSSRCEQGLTQLPAGKHIMKCHVDSLPLLEGRYMVDIEIFTGDTVADFVEHATVVDVSTGNFFGRAETLMPVEGRVLARSDWELE
jgi:lipopolysaccharide transport system ATP-binding protein